jgi:hypothetical protein
MTNGKLYITKESQKNLKMSFQNDIKGYGSFREYFVNAVRYRDKAIEKVVNSGTQSIRKKKKMASTSKIKHIPNIEGLGDPMKTEYNKDSDSDDYEIEYIEKLKKRGDLKVHVKPINLSVWVSDEFPIKMTHFLPLLHILSFTSSEFAQLKSTLISSFPFNSFPLKISFPIGLSFYALLSVTNFSLGPVDESVFEVNYQDTPIDSNNVRLDNNYAQDFYERYYKEKNIEGSKSYTDSFCSQGGKGNDVFVDEDYRVESKTVKEDYYTNTDKNADNEVGYALSEHIDISNGGIKLIPVSAKSLGESNYTLNTFRSISNKYSTKE